MSSGASYVKLVSLCMCIAKIYRLHANLLTGPHQNQASAPIANSPPEMSDTDDDTPIDHFEEPPSYCPTTPPPTFSTHTLLSGPTLTLRLVGHDPLWGHHLWNSGRVLAHYLEQHAPSLVTGKDVLELGAGAGLPGIVCGGVGGARRVTPPSSSTQR